MEIACCTEKLKKWLDSSSTPVHGYKTNRTVLQEYFNTQPYPFFETDILKFTRQPEHKDLTSYGVLYWCQVQQKFIEKINSDRLKKVFHYVETAPLLCFLSDFLSPLDTFLSKYEATCKSKQGHMKGQEIEEQINGKNALFVEGLEFYCLIKSRLQEMKYYWRIVVSKALPEHFRGFVEAYQHLLISTMADDLLPSCKSIMHDCYSENSKPRYLQLCDSLKLTEKEQEAMHYIFMRNAGIIFSKLHNSYSFDCKDTGGITGSHSNSMAMAAALFAEMNGYEMYEFFSESRTHLKQELFAAEDEFSSLLNSMFLKMPPTVVKACCGCTLTAEELYKVDKTVMGDILNAEKEEDEEKKELTTKEVEEKETDLNGGENDEDEMIELEAILRACDEVQGSVKSEEGETKGESQPYTTDLEYLEDNFELIETLVKARKTETSDDMLLLRPDQRRPEAVLREMKAKARSITAKIEGRMNATRRSGAWLPRLERLAELRRLDKFEKNALLTLTGCMVSRNLRDSGHNDSVFRHNINIGLLIGLFCEGLEEQIKARVYFYRNSHLVSEGLVHVSDPPLLSRGNFLDCGVELDRRLLDYIVGLDTEINELVDGSDLYTPDTSLSDVALPTDQRQLLLNTFDSFEKFQKTCKELKLSTHGYSKGLCLLFYGPSGTGKTMTANAVANYLGKKLLLVTVSILTEAQVTKDLLRFLFREAKIHNAVIFFDECETLFETRDNRSNTSLALLLTEIEQYDGIIFLATNRHQDLDEAMHRRIQLALPFSVPDYTLRMEIWKSHVPAELTNKESIDWTSLAQNYELTGGLIRNAVLSAISLAAKKSSTNEDSTTGINLSSEDLHKGAKLQLRGLLEMVDFERRIIPTYGLDEVVLETSTHKQIEVIINAGKTHKFISTQWGFNGVAGENVALVGGIVCLLCGPAGVGKTAIAHSIAYELGQPIKEANCTELLSHTVSTNPRGGRSISIFFRDAQRANAIIVLDGAEFILGSASSSLLSGLIGCESYSLAYQIEHYPGMVILTSRQEAGLLDLGRLPGLRFVVPLRPPGITLREKIWRKLLPKKAPVAINIDFAQLAERFTLTGGEIARVICSAAEIVAAASEVHIDTALLVKAAEDHMISSVSGRTQHLSLFL